MIPVLIDRLQALILKADFSISVLFIDDGSTDQSQALLKSICNKNEAFNLLILSRNFGHQNALSAGIDFCHPKEGLFILDADLQDPPELLLQFYPHLHRGFDVVYGVRKKRKENILKRSFYFVAYRLLKRISDTEIKIDSGDFSLISTKALKELKQLPEKEKFIRGLRSWIGLKQIGIEYERNSRTHGKSKYSIKKLMSLSFNGLYNFSNYPIKWIARFGLLAIGSSLLYFTWVVIKKYFFGNVPDGFTALLFMIILFGGLQLLAIGIIGQYIIRIFFQVKNRPSYIVKETIIH